MDLCIHEIFQIICFLFQSIFVFQIYAFSGNKFKQEIKSGKVGSADSYTAWAIQDINSLPPNLWMYNI